MNKFQGANGLRAIACLAVVIHHLGQRLNFSDLGTWGAFVKRLIPMGANGVSIFFVLSGFLLASPFWEAYFNQSPMPSCKIYAIRRAARIAPAFYLNLFVCYIVTLMIIPEYNASSGLPKFPALFWRYLSGLSFTAGFHWLTLFPSEINGPLWSISFEVISYTLMLLAMIGFFSFSFFKERPSLWKGLLWWSLILALIFLVNQYIVDHFTLSDVRKEKWDSAVIDVATHWMPGYNPIGFFAHFSLGILASGLVVWLYWANWSGQVKKRGIGDLFSLIFSVVVCWILFDQTKENPSFSSFQEQPYDFPFFAGAIALLLVSLSQSRWIYLIFDNPFFNYIATISYGVYIWHDVFINLTFYWLFPDDYLIHLNQWIQVAVLVLVMTFATASFSWILLEKPILNAAHAWSPRASATSFLSNRSLLIVVGIGGALILIPFLLALSKPSSFNTYFH